MIPLSPVRLSVILQKLMVDCTCVDTGAPALKGASAPSRAIALFRCFGTSTVIGMPLMLDCLVSSTSMVKNILPCV